MSEVPQYSPYGGCGGSKHQNTFHPHLSTENQARIYFTSGGVPLYLLALKPD